jgi:hypothetical protein
MKVGVAAIFKNEYPYILEWIAYHQSIGVDKFYIADNISNDGSTELLEALDDIGIITRIPYPRVEGQAPQAPAYNHIIQNYGDEVDLLGFVDADEFIVSEGDLKENLAAFYSDDNYGAMGLNWKVFGSNNDYFGSNGLIVKRFTKHAKIDFDSNRHIKTFLKPNFVIRMNIHECVLRKGKYCTSSNTDADFDESGARTQKTSHANIFVNHYVVKSRVEHFINKRKKGSAAGLASREKGISYFIGHDENAEVSEFPPELIGNLQATIKKLKRQLRDNSSFMVLGKGHVDVNTITNVVSGWVTGEKKTPAFITLLIDNKEYKIAVNRQRQDVLKKGLSAELVCGFSFSSGLELAGKDVSAKVYGSIQELKVNIHAG